MKILLNLLKNEFLRISKINLIRFGDVKKRQRTILLYLVICVAASVFLFSYASEMRDIFLLSWKEDEIINTLIIPLVMVCLILNIAVSVFWGSGLLLSDTNADTQLALPVRLSILAISKLFVLYVILALLDMLLLLPMVILFGITSGAGILSYLIMTVNVLLLPTVPCLFGTIIGAGIYRILRSPSALVVRLKTLFVVVLLFAYMVFMFWKFPDISKGDFSFSLTSTMLFSLGSRYMKSLLQHNILSLAAFWTMILIFDGLLLQALVAFCWKWYCDSDSRREISALIGSKAFIPNKAIPALIKRERRRYFSTLAYITNAASGFLFALVFVILVGMANDKITPYIDLFSNYFQIAPAATDILYVYALTILTSLSSTTYASISIEGKQINVLKSLPISAQDVFIAKVLFHLSLSVPVIVILNTVMTLILHLPWYIAVLGYIMPLSFSVFIGVAGYILNLLFPNFEWDNVTQIIKQSFPAILSTLLCAIVTCGTTYLLLRFFSDVVILGSFIACIVIILIVCVMMFWLKEYGKQVIQYNGRWHIG